MQHSHSSPKEAPAAGAREQASGFRPLIFGEALFDHFPDGSRILGGAPFNVAWHLRGFKADPLLVTAVGRDPEGEEILHRMASWEMDTAGVQLHPSRPTGRVTAHLDQGEPRYEIEAEQAYDGIRPEALPDRGPLGGCGLLYHGTLALRDPLSAGSLAALSPHISGPTLIDVNLRSPWWDARTVLRHLQGTEWVKVNREEVGLLARRSVVSEAELETASLTLREESGIRNLVVTLGEAGSVAFSPAGAVGAAAHPVADTEGDPVGAGDAFSAVLALGIHRSWELGLLLERASAFAAEICRIRGATAADARLYQRHMEEWNHAS